MDVSDKESENPETNEVSWFINLYKLNNRFKFINQYKYVILLLKYGQTQEEEEQQQEDDTEVNIDVDVGAKESENPKTNEVSWFISLYKLIDFLNV